MQDSDSIRNGPATRTGPVGRLARLALAVVAIASFVSIADQGGPSSFQGSRNLLEPSLLVLDAVMLALFVNLMALCARANPLPNPAVRAVSGRVSRLVRDHLAFWR